MNLPSYVSRNIRELVGKAGLTASIIYSMNSGKHESPKIEVPTELHPDPTADPYNGLGGRNFGRYTPPLDDDRFA